uniref:Uncharacterized protein n=1 Tax=Lutzomyia longipalpis TaxID=7200 RepID=A0A7G3B3I9_LUTLO
MGVVSSLSAFVMASIFAILLRRVTIRPPGRAVVAGNVFLFIIPRVRFLPLPPLPDVGLRVFFTVAGLDDAFFSGSSAAVSLLACSSFSSSFPSASSLLSSSGITSVSFTSVAPFVSAAFASAAFISAAFVSAAFASAAFCATIVALLTRGVRGVFTFVSASFVPSALSSTLSFSGSPSSATCCALAPRVDLILPVVATDAPLALLRPPFPPTPVAFVVGVVGVDSLPALGVGDSAFILAFLSRVAILPYFSHQFNNNYFKSK